MFSANVRNGCMTSTAVWGPPADSSRHFQLSCTEGYISKISTWNSLWACVCVSSQQWLYITCYSVLQLDHHSRGWCYATSREWHTQCSWDRESSQAPLWSCSLSASDEELCWTSHKCPKTGWQQIQKHSWFPSNFEMHSISWLTD